MKKFALFLFLISFVGCIDLPGSCKRGQYYDAASLSCSTCLVNASLVPSREGFSCVCNENSRAIGFSKCKPCNATQVISTDGTSCVPMRCINNTLGRLVCRKCPNEYISVTQNYDGSPMREVQCVKCGRGYKAVNNKCVKCESCMCSKDQRVVRDRCVAKKFIMSRPKYEDKSLHPNELLDIVKYEYLCVEGDKQSCNNLATKCVQNFYTSDKGGPCRLWIQYNLVRPSGLPSLTVESRDDTKNSGEVFISSNENILQISLVSFLSNEVKFLQKGQEEDCQLPLTIGTGEDYFKECQINVTDLEKYKDVTFSPYLYVNNVWNPIPVTVKKPNSYIVQRGSWPTNKFSRFMLLSSSLTTTVNLPSVIYLRSLTVSLSVHRDVKRSKLRVHTSLEAAYATKSPLSHFVTISLEVKHDLPNASVLRGLEIWGGVLGSLLTIYAIIKWRGTVRRGGLQVSLLPILCGCVADALYFAALISALHALAVEAGALGITLPLSKVEEHTIAALVYASLSLKFFRVIWSNWKHSRCDLFFIDWSEYNPSLKDYSIEKPNNWRKALVAKEWISMQGKRRISPGWTVTVTLFILHYMISWQNSLPNSQGYKWASGALAWWSAYSILLVVHWISEKIFGSSAQSLLTTCRISGVSLLVFEEDLYAHYVHGRTDDPQEARGISASLSTCRLVCVSQLRQVIHQLSEKTIGNFGDTDVRKVLLTKFLGAFFERALDGLGWLASERTLLERLLDVELSAREAGVTSALLYDPVNSPPSCLNITWWGEEWTMATLDAMLYGCVLLIHSNHLLSCLITLSVWQVMVTIRWRTSKMNVQNKTNILI